MPVTLCRRSPPRLARKRFDGDRPALWRLRRCRLAHRSQQLRRSRSSHGMPALSRKARLSRFSMTKTLDIKIADILQNPRRAKPSSLLMPRTLIWRSGLPHPALVGTPKSKQLRYRLEDLGRLSRSDSRCHPSGDCRHRVPLGIKRRDLGNGGAPFRELRGHAGGRANDTSDIWAVRGGKYREASRSFRTRRPYPRAS